MLRDALSNLAGIPISRISRIQENASKLYKVYEIPKNNGKKRTISQPTPELKAIQRWLIRNVFAKLPVSTYATAYKKGASIRLNAEFHRNSLFTLHMDFENFFPSFTENNVFDFLKENTNLNQDDISFCVDLCCRFGALTVGSPSSPALTNAMMYAFDQQISDWCAERKLVYTRYADDINISSSSPDALGDAEGFIKDASKEFKFGNLKVNEVKTSYLSKKYRRSITGLNITPQGSISIGRDRKREIKSLVYKYKEELLPKELFWQVGGLIAFANDVEPTFVRSLIEKYGQKTIEELLHQRTPRGLK
ncbi:retron St85 family RNA-directed DNA polymerase [Pannonibacter phragmitetus]|uniref:retron St85 family RNA-directed DNA polymerase n=1 Tax=Pannonibacter phragmitetus TaxID=121719 RepID=UPI0009E4F418|nr:retron St85 family RNA-directed DNA polymerase [Pannonibacter phragmitetus]